MKQEANQQIIIIGAGPGGLMSALTLNKLGHDVIVFEKSEKTSYKIGESLLPGSLSIMYRLGLTDLLDKYNFKKKPSATFAWGTGQKPWTFSFAAPKESPWVYDHAIQVYRQEFEEILIEEAIRRGVVFKRGYRVSDFDIETDPESVTVQCKNPKGESENHRGSFLIDSSGQTGMVSKKYNLRRYDDFYKSMAIWSYYKGGKKIDGDLDGTTYSITFSDGWIWMIPLKDDIISVGVVVDIDSNKEIQEIGREKFYLKSLEKSQLAQELLGDAVKCEDVKMIRDWSFDSKVFYKNRAFLCGDAACFTDPLFSQGVHLAMQSGVSAASAIDYMLRTPNTQEEHVMKWYDRSYRDSYNRYHGFLASFYSYAAEIEGESPFWNKRKVSSLIDDRLINKDWYVKLRDNSTEESNDALNDFVNLSNNMIELGKHDRDEISGSFKEEELNSRRISWILSLNKQLRNITKLEWIGDTIKLVKSYEIHPLKFKLEPCQFLSNGKNTIYKYPVSQDCVDVMQSVKNNNISYKELIKMLRNIGQGDKASQFVVRLIEHELIKGYDSDGEVVKVQPRLRFDGVGSEYEV